MLSFIVIAIHSDQCIVYEGAFEDGKKHGQGKMTFKEHGVIYEGEWHDGLFTNKGVYTYSNGNKNEVAWKNGKRHGQSKITFPQGALDEIGRFCYDQEKDRINDCVICLEILEGDLSVLPRCNHTYHTSCIKDAYKISSLCPICRVENGKLLVIKTDYNPISSDLVIKQIEEYKIQNPQNQNEGADQIDNLDVQDDEELGQDDDNDGNNLQQGQPELLITQLDKLMQRLDGQEENSNVNNMEDITHLELALKNFDTTKINSLIQQLNEALNKEAELKIIDNPDKQDYENKLTLLKEAVENFKNSKQ